jgi:acyl carrier protein
MTMDNQAHYATLTTVFHDVFDDDSIVVTPELTADDVDEWDSSRHIRLVAAVEKQFGLSFSAAEIGRLKNVGQLVSLIEAKSGQ